MFLWSCLDYSPSQFDFINYNPEVEPPSPDYEISEYKKYMLSSKGSPCRDFLGYIIDFPTDISQPILYIPADTLPPNRIYEFTLSLTS